MLDSPSEVSVQAAELAGSACQLPSRLSVPAERVAPAGDAGDLDRQHGVGIGLAERPRDVEAIWVSSLPLRRDREGRRVGDRGDIDVDRAGGRGGERASRRRWWWR